MAIINDLREFLLSRKAIENPNAITDSDSLLEKGVIDSIIMHDLICFIEDKYGIAVDDDDMMPENFDSLTTIETYVNEKRNRS